MNAEMADGYGKGTLQLSDDEKQALGLWEQLQQLQLGIATLRAERDIVPLENATDDELEQAREHSVKASAIYETQKSALDAVLVANPILQAVHAGENADPIERWEPSSPVPTDKVVDGN